MFVYYYASVPQPLQVAEAGLEQILSELESYAADAHKDGEAVAKRLRVGTGRAAAKEVELLVWPVATTEGVITRKMTWRATGPSALFPEMDADLVLARLDDQVTQVSLRGSYQPPLGLMGRALDKALFHRVAEMTVKQFVDRVVAALEPAVSELG